MSHNHAAAGSEDVRTPATQGHVLHWARFYDPVTSLCTLGHRAQLRRETVDLAGIQPGAAVLDVGCGTGDVALAAHQRTDPTGTVCGIDPAPEMIAVARRKAARAGVDVNFQIGVIEGLAFPTASFDFVLSSLMMHHLPHDVKRRGLAEIMRVLRPGGRVLIIDAKRPAVWLGRVMTTVLGHAALREGIQDLPALLHEAGFTNVHSGSLRLRVLGFVSGQRLSS
jgi:ubiquinone/menaquinone biosynthesis C-methylase UbiE